MFNLKLKSQESYTYTCQDSGCLDDGICRCSKIKNFKIETDLLEIAKQIYDNWLEINWNEKQLFNRFLKIIKLNHHYDYNEVNIFTIYRLLLIHNINTNSWQPNIIKGYYGEEIESFSLKPEIAKNLKKNIDTIISIVELTKKLRFILKLEGVRIPNNLSSKIINISSDLIDSNVIVKQHNNIPNGIALYSNNRYKIISGWSVEGTNKLFVLKKNNKSFNLPISN